MGRKALAEGDRRIVHGFSISPVTRERIAAVVAKTGESSGVLLDRLVEAEYTAIIPVRRRKVKD
jgi:hypothetical protein